MSRNYGGGYAVGHEEIMAVPPGDQADFLEKMIDALEQGGWTQGSHQDDQGMCIEGATRHVMGDSQMVRSWAPIGGGFYQVPPLCVTGFAAENTLREVLGAELGVKKISMDLPKNSGPWVGDKEMVTVDGYDSYENNPIPVFNDQNGQTKERVIGKLREVVEEIRAGVGVFDGDAPKEPTRTLSTVPTPV